jgi:hypothetical protein
MAISISEPIAAVVTTDAFATYSIGPFTPTANAVIFLHIAATDLATQGTPTITNLQDTASRTWTLIDSIAYTNTDEYKLFAYWAPAGASPSSTTIDVTFDENLAGCILQVLEMTGVNTTNPKVQSDTTDSGNLTVSYSLNSAPDSQNAVVALNQIRRNPPGWTPEAGWYEWLDNAHTNPANGLCVWTKTGDQTVTATGTNGTNWGIIYEVRAGSKTITTDIQSLIKETLTLSYETLSITTSGKTVTHSVEANIQGRKFYYIVAII